MKRKKKLLHSILLDFCKNDSISIFLGFQSCILVHASKLVLSTDSLNPLRIPFPNEYSEPSFDLIQKVCYLAQIDINQFLQIEISQEHKTPRVETFSDLIRI